MNELEELKKRKLAAMQQQNESSEEEVLNQQMNQLEIVVKQNMTKKAIERYSNIKLIDEEKALKTLVLLGQLLQSGKINNIDDETLKKVLITLHENKNIKIKRK